MKIKYYEDGRHISDTATQKDIENYLVNEYGINRSWFRRFVKEARDNKYIWDSFKKDDSEITVYVVPRHMFIASVPV